VNGHWRAGTARAVDALCVVAGRRQVVRAARFVLNRARWDVPNVAACNGEHALQRWALAALPRTAAVTALDVGANVGDWSRSLLEHASRSGHDVALHAFEAAAHTYSLLTSRLPAGVRTNRVALSDSCGERTMYLVRPGAGTNSLYPPDGHRGGADRETVATTTLDDYARLNHLSRIDLVKIDTEGHDFAVLAGARESLRTQAISIVQFEYNHRWIPARRFLKDVFGLVQPFGYRIGKLTPRGIEKYPAWEPELESFVEGNYVLYTEQAGRSLPAFGWWKSPRRYQ
jgi:FkbM family methyltransferase